MDHEVRYNTVKKNGKVMICTKFAVKGSDGWLTELYLPIVVKALKLTESEIKDYGACSYDDKRNAISEFCRLNLTKWQMVDAPKEVLPYVNQLIGKTLWLYFNGAEHAWKFYDPDGCIDEANNEQYIVKKGKMADSKIAMINDIAIKYDRKCYDPHDDEAGNYGDETIHAVYDMTCNNSTEEDEADNNTAYCCNGNRKIELALKLIDGTKAKLDQIYDDLVKKQKNHKKIAVSNKLFREVLDEVSCLSEIY